MSSSPAASAHQFLPYGGTQELLLSVVPFLLDGIRDGDTVVLAVPPAEELAILQAVGDASRIRLVGTQGYSSPATAEREMLAFLDELLEAGAARIRIVGGLPKGFEAEWEAWADYEAAMDVAIHRLPVAAMCIYDSAATEPRVTEHACRLHPTIALPFGRSEANPVYAGD